jgi:hypothetical protein
MRLPIRSGRAVFAYRRNGRTLRWRSGLRSLLGQPLLARFFSGDTQITHLPPHEQGPCAYQYQHLDEFE